MEKKVALVLSLMLLMSMNSVLVSAEEASPTIGQRVDTATNDVTNFYNEHAGPTADTVSSTAKSVYNWFGDKAKELGL